MAVVAWPPPTPPDNRVNGTTSLDAHPDDHNLIANALDTLIGAGPLLWSGYKESHTVNGFVDTGISWTFTDGASYDFDTIAVIYADTFTTGWVAALAGYPWADIYSNSFSDPWVPAAGIDYGKVIGEAYGSGNLQGAGNPVRMPPMVACEYLAPTYTIAWTVRMGVHNAAGAISWSGGYHVTVERRRAGTAPTLLTVDEVPFVPREP